MKEKIEAQDLADYLRGLAAASLFVVSITSPVFEIGSTLKSAYDIAHVAEKRADFFGEGPFWIESRPGDQWQDKQFPEPVIANYAVVWTIYARLARSGIVIGGYDQLIKGLSGFEVLERRSPKSVDGAGAGHLLVKQPSDPIELEELRNLLLKYSAYFAFDDGTGKIHHGNIVIGNGVYSELEESFKGNV